MPTRIRTAAAFCAPLTSLMLAACAVSVTPTPHAADCCQEPWSEPRPVVATAHPSRCDDFPVTHRAEPARGGALRVAAEPPRCR